jgi:hypothetical protein
VEDKFICLKHGLELADKVARNLGEIQIEYERGKLGIWTLVKLWQLKWKNRGNKNSVALLKERATLMINHSLTLKIVFMPLAHAT